MKIYFTIFGLKVGWLGLLNFLLLQFLFIRLAARYESDEFLGWKIIGPIVPFTRWKYGRK